MTLQFVRIGYIIKPHGQNGMILIRLDNPDAVNMDQITSIYMGNTPENFRNVQIEFVKTVNRGVLVQQKSRVSHQELKQWVNLGVWLTKDQLKRNDTNTYYHYQLKGMKVYTINNLFLGILDEIIETGANDVYVVRSESSEYLIPAIQSVVRNIDVESKTMIIEPMQNMLE